MIISPQQAEQDIIDAVRALDGDSLAELYTLILNRDVEYSEENDTFDVNE